MSLKYGKIVTLRYYSPSMLKITVPVSIVQLFNLVHGQPLYISVDKQNKVLWYDLQKNENTNYLYESRLYTQQLPNNNSTSYITIKDIIYNSLDMEDREDVRMMYDVEARRIGYKILKQKVSAPIPAPEPVSIPAPVPAPAPQKQDARNTLKLKYGDVEVTIETDNQGCIDILKGLVPTTKQEPQQEKRESPAPIPAPVVQERIQLNHVSSSAYVPKPEIGIVDDYKPQINLSADQKIEAEKRRRDGEHLIASRMS